MHKSHKPIVKQSKTKATPGSRMRWIRIQANKLVGLGCGVNGLMSWFYPLTIPSGWYDLENYLLHISKYSDSKD